MERAPKASVAGAGLPPGAVVVVYLQNPRDRYWGVLRSLDVTGVVLHGLELDAFDDWARQVAEGGEGLTPTTMFFPLGRVEKILLDAPGGPVPSLRERFESRTGRSLGEALDLGVAPGGG